MDGCFYIKIVIVIRIVNQINSSERRFKAPAEQAIEIPVMPDSHGSLWGIAWRARAAAWILRHRATLERALN